MTNRIIFFLVATSVFIRQESFSHTQFNDLLCVLILCNVITVEYNTDRVKKEIACTYKDS